MKKYLFTTCPFDAVGNQFFIGFIEQEYMRSNNFKFICKMPVSLDWPLPLKAIWNVNMETMLSIEGQKKLCLPESHVQMQHHRLHCIEELVAFWTMYQLLYFFIVIQTVRTDISQCHQSKQSWELQTKQRWSWMKPGRWVTKKEALLLRSTWINHSTNTG